MKFAAKLIVTTLVISFVSIILLDLVIFNSVRTSVERNISENQSESVDRSMINIDRYLSDRIFDLNHIARQDLSNLIDSGGQTTGQLSADVIARINSEIEDDIKSRNAWIKLRLINSTGNIVFSTDIQDSGKNITSETYLSDVISFARKGISYNSDVYLLDGSANVPSLIISSPIILKSGKLDNQPLILIGYLRWDGINNLLNSKDERLFLYNGKADVIGTNDPAHVGKILSENHAGSDSYLKTQTAANSASPVLIANHEGLQTLIVFEKEPGYESYAGNGWFLFSEISAGAVLKPAYQTAYFLTGISTLIALTGICIIVLFIYFNVIKPFHEFAVVGKAISEQDFSRRVNLATNDEMGNLARVINSMIDNLREFYTRFDIQVNKKTELLSDKVDIIEFQKDEIAKQKIELEKYRLAVEHAPIHIIITDRDGKILYANPASTRITGYSLQEMIGQKSSLWGAQMPSEYYQKLWYTIKTEHKQFTGEIINKRKNGDLYTSTISIAPIFDDHFNVSFFVGVERDITKEKEVDRMKTEFISLTSHQLRTPLTAIKWLTELLLSDPTGSLSEIQKTYIGKINLSNTIMIDLVNSLLNISRIEAGRLTITPVPTHLPNLVTGIIEELMPETSGHSQHIKLNADKGIPEINIDPKLIRQVYLNLLTNAVNYSSDGSDIQVKIYPEGEFVISQVSDRGIGIPDKDKPGIFEHFFRGRNADSQNRQGTGLGLYLAKLIVDASGGKIWFESEVGRGSSFWFSLPLAGIKPTAGVVSLAT